MYYLYTFDKIGNPNRGLMDTLYNLLIYLPITRLNSMPRALGIPSMNYLSIYLPLIRLTTLPGASGTPL